MNEILSLYDFLANHKNSIFLDFEDPFQDRCFYLFLVKTGNTDIGYPVSLLKHTKGKDYVVGNKSGSLIPFEHHVKIVTHIVGKLAHLPDNKIRLTTSSNIRYFLNDFFWLKIHQLIGSKTFIDLLVNYNIFDYKFGTNGFFQLSGISNLSQQVSSQINYETLRRFIPSILMSNIKFVNKNKKSVFDVDNLIMKDSKSWISLSKDNKTSTDLIEANHKKIRYMSILNSMIPSIKETSEKPNSINSVVNKKKVYEFLKVILNKLIPNNFYKHPKNKVIFYRNISKLILMDFNQFYDFKYLLTNVRQMKENDFFLENMLFWLYFRYIPSLIKEFFYVTKLNVGYQLVYYRHDDAMIFLEPLINNYISKFLTSDSIKCNGNISFHDKSLEYYHCHFRPVLKNLKIANNFRFLCVPNYKLSVGSKKEQYYIQQDIIIPINKSLNYFRKHVFSKQFQHKDALTSSINDVIYNFKNFKTKRAASKKPLYFIKFDVKSSYDSIPKDYLKQILQDIFSNSDMNEFYLTTENTVTTSKVIHTTNKKLAELKTNKRIKISNEDNNFVNKKRKLSNKQYFVPHIGSNIRILQEASDIRKFTIEDVKHIINKELESTIINIGKNCYYRKLGISQGLYFSSILANIFYDSLVLRYKKEFLSANGFFARFMDDFLIISDDFERINQVKSLILSNSFKENFNIDINMEKLEFSSNVNASDGQFSFVGLNFDLKKMSVAKDFETLTLVKYDHLISYKELFNKLILVFKMRISNELLFSLELNSIDSILAHIGNITKNIAEMFVHFVAKNKKLETKTHFFKKFISNLINLVTETLGRQNQFKFYKEKSYYRFKDLSINYELALIDCFAKVCFENLNKNKAGMFIIGLSEIRNCVIDRIT
ncbi:hypothetical protein QEN19_002420 [Hanseniaspora menglaensis]